MTLTEASRTLGIHYISVLRLKRQGKLRATPDGVDATSVIRYLEALSRPLDALTRTEAAARLGIPKREVVNLADAKLIRVVERTGPGYWYSEEDVEELAAHPEKLAILGHKVKPPAGWLTGAEAQQRLRCGRSWLSRLSRRGLIRRRTFGNQNAWYSEEDIQAYLSHDEEVKHSHVKRLARGAKQHRTVTVHIHPNARTGHVHPGWGPMVDETPYGQ